MKIKLILLLLLICIFSIRTVAANKSNKQDESIKIKVVQNYFDSINSRVYKNLNGIFSRRIKVNIAGMKFNGRKAVVRFCERDVYGGVYTVEKVFLENDEIVVHCLFKPKNWSSPEPPIEYRFLVENNEIISWNGRYR